MAKQKNQHFVPRCALKPFSVKGEGRAVHLYNFDADRPIQDAPIRGQCSKNYFYGRDLKIENILAGLEGHYSRIIGLLTMGANLSEADEDWLRLFTLVQSRRTEAALAELGRIQAGFVCPSAFRCICISLLLAQNGRDKQGPLLVRKWRWIQTITKSACDPCGHQLQ